MFRPGSPGRKRIKKGRWVSNDVNHCIYVEMESSFIIKGKIFKWDKGNVLE